MSVKVDDHRPCIYCTGQSVNTDLNISICHCCYKARDIILSDCCPENCSDYHEVSDDYEVKEHWQ